MRRAHFSQTLYPNFSRGPRPSSEYFYQKGFLQLIVGSSPSKNGAHTNLPDWVTGTGRSAAFFSVISSKKGTRTILLNQWGKKKKSKVIPATGVKRAWEELTLVILFEWSTLGMNRPYEGIGVGALHIGQKKKLGEDIEYTFHTGSRHGSWSWLSWCGLVMIVPWINHRCRLRIVQRWDWVVRLMIGYRDVSWIRKKGDIWQPRCLRLLGNLAAIPTPLEHGGREKAGQNDAGVERWP